VSVCIPILVWCIEHFTVLEVVEELVEQVEVVDDLRRRVEETEEYVDNLKRSNNALTGVNIGSSLPPHQGPSYAG
jgi:hypothetical protein